MDNEKDIKVMVEASGKVGRTVMVENNPGIHNKEVPGDYHEYKGSQAKQEETYSNRQAALTAALGNKDEVKG